MEENMADVKNGNRPSTGLIELYRRWGEGGAAMILSGHVMVDPLALACPGDVVLAAETIGNDNSIWRKWMGNAQSHGAQFWLQINHPGRQSRSGSGLPTCAPSPIAVDIGQYSYIFSEPLEMIEQQIRNVIERFVWTAQKAEEFGVSGVETHAAHGYLIAQFLSPLSNHRSDSWGGSLENRAKLLFEIISAIRTAVSNSFGLGVKINTSDFQRGGFDTNDLHWIIERLNGFNLDFVELSGGSMEMLAFRGAKSRSSEKSVSTVAREAYFIQAASDIKDIARMPLIVTGGIRDVATLSHVLGSGDNILAGIATGFGLLPDLVNRWARGEHPNISLASSWVLPGILEFAASTACVQWNLHLIGSRYSPWPGVWPAFALWMSNLNESRQMAMYKSGLDDLLAKCIQQ